MKLCVHLVNNKNNLADWYDWKHMYNNYLKYVRKNHTVLEIGASNSSKTSQLSQHCNKLIGVEYIPDRRLEDVSNIEYITGDWEKLTEFIHEESIDVAIASHVIEHVPNDLKAMNELYRVLKKGGVAIINTPNRNRFVRIIIELFRGPRRFPWWEHVREYTEEDLHKLLSKSQFQENYKIIPVVFGLHAHPLCIYLDDTPKLFERWANFYEIHLLKK